MIMSSCAGTHVMATPQPARRHRRRSQGLAVPHQSWTQCDGVSRAAHEPLLLGRRQTQKYFCSRPHALQTVLALVDIRRGGTTLKQAINRFPGCARRVFICSPPRNSGWELLPTRARSSKSTTAPLLDSQSYLNCNVPRKSPTARCVPVDDCPARRQGRDQTSGPMETDSHRPTHFQALPDV